MLESGKLREDRNERASCTRKGTLTWARLDGLAVRCKVKLRLYSRGGSLPVSSRPW